MMSNPADEILSQSSNVNRVPQGDEARQAVAALRGYAYQLVATALAWVDIDDGASLYLEVAEDYAVRCGGAFQAVQIKDTTKSSKVTLISKGVRDAIAAFVHLVEHNPDVQVYLRFFTTSEIGMEQALKDRPAGMAGLEYWRKAARRADPKPLRAVIEESERFPESVRDFFKIRSDEEIRKDILRKIHWDCGKPDFTTLRLELEERLIVLCRDRFCIPAPEAPRLADNIIYRVLQIIVNTQNRNDRVLKRATLYKTIDMLTRVTLARSGVDDLIRTITSSIRSDGSSADLRPSPKPNWIIDSSTLPVKEGMISRPAVESQLSKVLLKFGVGILVGGTGVGKSSVSMSVTRSGTFVRADFRDLDAKETCHRLDLIFAQIDRFRSPVLILEDLNQLHDERVIMSLSRVIDASRRRDREIIITCHRKPSNTTLSAIQADLNVIVHCPHFSNQETFEIVRHHGGDPKKWGRIACLTAAGHPLLTHAFAIGMAARQWPDDEVERLIGSRFKSSDIDHTRDEALRHIVNVLPKHTRLLLYRLSLTIGSFSRSMALAIGDIPPLIAQAGESVNQLIGPWIEPVGSDRFVVSPLARTIGEKMLTGEKQLVVHRTIAVEMLKKSTVDAGDVDAITAHAILSKSKESLTAIASMLLSTDTATLEKLSEHLLLFRLFSTDRPFYETDPAISILLRLAQFKLAVAGRRKRDLPGICSALLRELDSISDNEHGHLETLVLITLLCTIGVANYLDNWIDLLHRYKVLAERIGSQNDAMMMKVIHDVRNLGVDFYGALFSIGIAGLASVKRLEHVINGLNELEDTERERLLTPTNEEFADYHTIVNQPWSTQDLHSTLDAEDAAERYGRMAKTAGGWAIRTVAVQCSVAQAVLLYDRLRDNERALSVLEAAKAVWGDDYFVDIALAEFYSFTRNYSRSLDIFRRLADSHDNTSSVEQRAYRLRDSAISAARQKEWDLACRWFLDARTAAMKVRADEMRAVAVGLSADAAISSFWNGDIGQTLLLLTESVDSLSSLNPKSLVGAAYCRRLVCSAVFWVKVRVMGHDIPDGVRPVETEPGICSNPTPPAMAQELSLVDIDVSRYHLAEIEIASGLDLGISIGSRLTNRAIPLMELELCKIAMEYAIDRLDPSAFSIWFVRYIEIVLYFPRLDELSPAELDLTNPKRVRIPPLDENTRTNPNARRVAYDAIWAYCIRSVTLNSTDAIGKLEDTMCRRLGRQFPGIDAFRSWRSEEIKADIQNGWQYAYFYWGAGYSFLKFVTGSRFGGILIPCIAAWERECWTRIVSTQRFRLLQPWRTVPLIEDYLTGSTDDKKFLADILLVTSEAIGVSLNQTDSDFLRSIAEEHGSRMRT